MRTKRELYPPSRDTLAKRPEKVKSKSLKPWSMKRLHCYAVSNLRYGYNPEVLYHLALEAKLIPHPAAQWLSSCFETAAFAAQRAKRDAAVSKSPGGSPLWLPDPDENLIDRARAALEKFANDSGFRPEVVQIADHPRRERPQLSLRFGSMVIAFRLREAA